MIHVLILARDATIYLPFVERDTGVGVTVHACEDVAMAMGVVGRCQVILGQPDLVARVLAHAKRLEWVQSTFAGVDALCRPGLRRDYRLTGVKGLFGSLMSEYVFGYILAMERQVVRVAQNQGRHVWQPLACRSLRGMTLGVCGLGSIGRHVARTGATFGMEVVGYRRCDAPVQGVDRLYSGEGFFDFLGAADYVVALLPATPKTHHLFDKAAFSAMKPSAIFMNAGRGGTVRESDLIAALRRREIAGAVLDVFEEEPLNAESPLWDMEGVMITPHISAFSFPEEIAGIFLRNLSAFTAGRPLAYGVDFSRGY